MRKEIRSELTCERSEKIMFFYEGKQVEGYSNETFAEALSAAGICGFGKSSGLQMPLKLLLVRA